MSTDAVTFFGKTTSQKTHIEDLVHVSRQEGSRSNMVAVFSAVGKGVLKGLLAEPRYRNTKEYYEHACNTLKRGGGIVVVVNSDASAALRATVALIRGERSQWSPPSAILDIGPEEPLYQQRNFDAQGVVQLELGLTRHLVIPISLSAHNILLSLAGSIDNFPRALRYSVLAAIHKPNLEARLDRYQIHIDRLQMNLQHLTETVKALDQRVSGQQSRGYQDEYDDSAFGAGGGGFGAGSTSRGRRDDGRRKMSKRKLALMVGAPVGGLLALALLVGGGYWLWDVYVRASALEEAAVQPKASKVQMEQEPKGPTFEEANQLYLDAMSGDGMEHQNGLVRKVYETHITAPIQTNLPSINHPAADLTSAEKPMQSQFVNALFKNISLARNLNYLAETFPQQCESELTGPGKREFTEKFFEEHDFAFHHPLGATEIEQEQDQGRIQRFEKHMKALEYYLCLAEPETIAIGVHALDCTQVSKDAAAEGLAMLADDLRALHNTPEARQSCK
jgi:hypothetical protein